MNKDLAGPWVRRFLIEYVMDERNYSSHTQHSYRDMFRLFLPFAAKRLRRAMDQLPLTRIQPKTIRAFTQYLEQVRHCGPGTINQRLAAPDQQDGQGFRDYALLLFLYNTGARASEASCLKIGDLDLVAPVATLHGKGRRVRQCPLWKVTTTALRRLVGNGALSQAVFVNRSGQPLTRYGIHTLVERHADQAALKVPALRTKRVSPHTIRHATAMGLLRSGVDINTIRIWLGHVSLQTTHIYAESDLKMKAEALARCEAPLLQPGKNRTAQKDLMGFLRLI